MSCCGAHICQVSELVSHCYCIDDYSTVYALYYTLFQVCIERIQTNEQSCPCCRSEKYINVLNKNERAKVLELKVHCLNSEKECDFWVGELGGQERHVGNKCQ